MYPTPPTIIDHPADANHYSTVWDGARCIVIHATAGTNSLDWLSTTSKPPVSIQVLAPKDGTLIRIVKDRWQAFHVGRSNIGNHTIAAGDQGSASEIAYGIEFENRNNGEDPYPIEQIDAGAYQIALWWRQDGFLPLLTHALVDTQGKTDPRGLDMIELTRRAIVWYDWLDQAPSPPATSPYTINSKVLATPFASQTSVIKRVPAPSLNYDELWIRTFLMPLYWRKATAAGLDPVLAIAQLLHETANLGSFWSADPQNNPAGIGVTGDWRPVAEAQPQPAEFWRQNPQRGNRWERGNSFADWEVASDAHLGRLLAYALPAGQGTSLQKRLIDYALLVRPLPAAYRGIAPTLAGLNGRWAAGNGYANALAKRANQLAGS